MGGLPIFYTLSDLSVLALLLLFEWITNNYLLVLKLPAVFINFIFEANQLVKFINSSFPSLILVILPMFVWLFEITNRFNTLPKPICESYQDDKLINLIENYQLFFESPLIFVWLFQNYQLFYNYHHFFAKLTNLSKLLNSSKKLPTVIWIHLPTFTTFFGNYWPFL